MHVLIDKQITRDGGTIAWYVSLRKKIVTGFTNNEAVLIYPTSLILFGNLSYSGSKVEGFLVGIVV